MAKQISAERKGAFYLGTTIMVIGGLLFGSVFLTAAMSFGDFPGSTPQFESIAFRGFGGMMLLIIGGFIRTVGARGMAGAGVVLNPEQAREELEPYSRMAGGMAKDALEAADINLSGRAEQTVMIRCTKCRKLNEEDSKFCQECGAEI